MRGDMLTRLKEAVKKNLIITHYEDDELIDGLVLSAVEYAETYQNREAGYYTRLSDDFTALSETVGGTTGGSGGENAGGSGTAGGVMPETTRQAVIMLASHLYESRDGSTGGFFADNVNAEDQCWKTVNRLLAMNKEWCV